MKQCVHIYKVQQCEQQLSLGVVITGNLIFSLQFMDLYNEHVCPL